MAERTGLWSVLTTTFAEWSDDKAPRLGAALAYYTSLSIAPLLLVCIGIAGLVFGQEAARGQIVGQLRGLLGDEAARGIQDLLAHAQRPASGMLSTVIGVVTLLGGASGVFGQLQDALNTIWAVEPKPGRGWRGFVKDRFLSLTMVLGTGFLLLVSLIATAAVAAFATALHLGSETEVLGHLVVTSLSFVVTAALFALIFKRLPDVEIGWGDVLVGAATTAVLFGVGKLAIGLYLGHASIGSAYGAAGSFVVILVWVYYSAQILLFGAELTKVWARRHGAHVRPTADAIRVEEVRRTEQAVADSG